MTQTSSIIRLLIAAASRLAEFIAAVIMLLATLVVSSFLTKLGYDNCWPTVYCLLLFIIVLCDRDSAPAVMIGAAAIIVWQIFSVLNEAQIISEFQDRGLARALRDVDGLVGSIISTFAATALFFAANRVRRTNALIGHLPLKAEEEQL
ncbi:hypothetical protein [Bradyrhizobium elkanii]|uniref:hypothetical protein n=1 Tax=Bradyrhizobium elkanii TaxID=29448 RepID=UPI00351283B9